MGEATQQAEPVVGILPPNKAPNLAEKNKSM
jgi:hypothetical protein